MAVGARLRIAIAPKTMIALFRPLHLEAIEGARVHRAAHAADGVEFVGIDFVAAILVAHFVIEKRLENMEAQDFAKDQNAAAGLVADADDLMQAALHLHLAFGHARGLYQVARDRCQS
jgi:hypothetical protein